MTTLCVIFVACLALFCLTSFSEAGMFQDKMKSAGTSGNPMTSMLMAMIPPECKKQVEDISKEADKIYDWLVKQKCAECPQGVKASAVLLKEEIIKKCLDSYMDYLAGEDFDIDKLCPAKFRRAEIWKFYGEWREPCGVTPNEVLPHPNLCKATDKDFPKTSDCIKEKGTAVFKARATPPPMDCVNKALKKCNEKDLGKWKKHFLVDMKGDPNVHKGLNAWVLTNDFFKTKCTGKY